MGGPECDPSTHRVAHESFQPFPQGHHPLDRLIHRGRKMRFRAVTGEVGSDARMTEELRRLAHVPTVLGEAMQHHHPGWPRPETVHSHRRNGTAPVARAAPME